MKAGTKRKKESSLTTRQGIFLSLAIGALVALIFVLVVLYWHPPE
ncbi:MAG: hypothetical protein WBP98_03595 [Candidatus Sulfotelmatobacter sp.]